MFVLSQEPAKLKDVRSMEIKLRTNEKTIQDHATNDFVCVKDGSFIINKQPTDKTYTMRRKQNDDDGRVSFSFLIYI